MFLAIEGCIGVGKSTVAELLAQKNNWRLILEKFEKNPFLEKFYSEPGRHDFETELAFVLIHYHQLKDITNTEVGQSIVSDFYIDKDLLFAENNLRGKEYEIFTYLYNELSLKAPATDIIICLDGSDEFIFKRILERKREEEMEIDPEYIKKLNQRYKEFFENLKTPKIIVNMEERDFLNDPYQINWLNDEIDKLTKSCP